MRSPILVIALAYLTGCDVPVAEELPEAGVPAELRKRPDAGTPPAAFTAPCAALGGPIDLARGRPITASSTVDPTRGPEAMVDGEPETEWESERRGRVVVEVDLGRSYSLEQVALQWGAVHGRRIRVRGSSDGRRYVWMGRSRDADGGEDVVDVYGRARWVRVILQQPSEPSGFVVGSLAILGREHDAPTPPVALTATAVTPQVAELRWSPSTDDTGMLGYAVYRDGSLLGTTCCPRFQDAGLGAGITHAYVVTALDVFLNESDPSDAALATADPALPPLLSNGDFETGGLNGPADWSTGGFQPSLATFSWAEGLGRDGSRGVGLAHPEGVPNDTWWLQSTPLIAGGHYNLFGWARGEGIQGAAVGANLAVFGGFTHSSDAGSTGTFDWTRMAVTFPADPSGTTPLQARLGFFAGTVTGQAFFDDLVVPADDFASPPLSRHLDLVLERTDRTLIDEGSLQCWAAHLDDAYDGYRDLVGATPLGDPPQQVLSVRQFPGGLAVAGNPIRWFHPFVAPELERIVANDDWSFAILHELSHQFDRGGRWVFQGELSANFKMVYVLDRVGGRVRARGVYYEGSAIRDFFALRYDEAIAAGTFHWDAITYRLIRVVDAIGWLPFRRTYRDFAALPEEEVPATALATFELFLDRLSVHADVDVRTLWLPEELAWVAEQLAPG